MHKWHLHNSQHDPYERCCILIMDLEFHHRYHYMIPPSREQTSGMCECVLWFVVVAYDVSIELESHTKNSPEDV